MTLLVVIESKMCILIIESNRYIELIFSDINTYKISAGHGSLQWLVKYLGWFIIDHACEYRLILCKVMA